MKHMATRLRRMAALACMSLGLCGPVVAEEYSFGVVPQFEPLRLASTWIPILEELERRTGHRFVMSGTPDIPAFEDAFRRGAFDFAYMNPYHAVMAHDHQGYLPLLRDGGRQLFGILVVARDGGIDDPAQLAGKQVAFPAPNALGASLMIRSDLAQRFGIDCVPVYAATHSSAYLNVLLGRSAAAGGVMATFTAQPETVRNGLRIIHETQRVPPHPVVAHPRVSEEVREEVRRAFLDMAHDAGGQAALDRVPFREIVTATMEDYQPLRDMNLERFVE
ncbi:MAG: phosphate/phosphite/phosphonate ABC transporter substrate-binding protein [Sagittula sp.]|uniref:phosphate/phosphite/phosphonate ABC transporter substrate-binding protein n=1 Tax=Sagittula sp. TaxID=2038081 RepID=UPI0040582B1E